MVQKEDLERLYLFEKKTGCEIAAIYGVDKKTVFKALKKHGIKVRVGHPPPKALLTTEEMVKLYESGLPLEQVAKRSGVCNASVLGRFDRVGFRLRSPAFANTRPAPDLGFLSETDRAYFAGLIDGEGSIGLYKDKKTGIFSPTVTITNTYKPVLRWAQRILGMGNLTESKRRKPNLNHKTGYKIEFRRLSGILSLLKAVLPYLRIKRRQAKSLLSFCTRRIERTKEGRTGYSRKDDQSRLFLKRLNEKGTA